MKIGALISLVVVFVFHSVIAADWPMRGRDGSRNAVVAMGEGPIDWELPASGKPGRNVRWSADLGTVSQGDPVVSQGLVWVGTNNGRPRDPLRKEDGGVLMCFDERDGAFLYQYLSPRLPEGRDVDWPSSSQTASPLIEGDRLWFCNTRSEVVCLDIGPLVARTGEPSVVWKVDLREQFGVAPRAVMIGSNTVQCSIAAYREWIYINTTNAAGHGRTPAPHAPSLLCLNKRTGEVKWQDNSPGENLLDVQHGSPLVAELAGRAQVIMGQGDGWMRGFDALTGEVLWKFDINHKSADQEPSRFSAKRNDLVAMPVVYDGRVYFATGRHYELSGGPGRLCCLDPTKRGDISAEVLGDDGQPLPNPNSGLVWEYLGTSDGEEDRLHATLSSAVIHKGLVFVPDTSGFLHCVDAETGRGLWIHNLWGNVFSSPLIVGDRVYMPGESGVLVFAVSRQKQLLAEFETNKAIESSPIYAGDTLFLMTRDRLYAIGK